MLIVKIQTFITELTQVMISIIRIIVFSKIPSKLSVKKTSDSAVVLANGPSFSKMYNDYKSFLVGKDCICVNYFPSTPLYSEIKPKFVIISAPSLWLENLGDNYITILNDFHENIAKNTAWDVTFFIPCDARKYKLWQSILQTNKHISIIYYNNTPIEGFKWFSFLMYDWKLGMPRPQNVLIPTLYNLIQMRYKNVYLWGVDHSWFREISVTDDNVTLINQKHFYDENESKPLPMKSGKGGTHVRERRLHEVVYKFMKSFESYFILRDYAESKSIRIINNTKGSFIDAFDKEIFPPIEA